MYLTDLKIGDTAKITCIDGFCETKKRLRSFGVDSGTVVQIKHKSLSDSNIEIATDYGLVALRSEEAKMISCVRVGE